MHHVRDFLGIDAKVEEESRKSEAKVNIHELAKASIKIERQPERGYNKVIFVSNSVRSL